MAMVNITLNDQQVSVPSGSTVLEAAEQAGVDIPTLCHHPALAPLGSCRMCLVEIEGQNALQTACTFPVSDGMVVKTDTPKVFEARKFVLELLFAERNHYCMFCETSGDCELQDVGYLHGIDHWTYSTYTDRYPVDASRAEFIMDHNRCIVCRRCVRACNKLVANHTLLVKFRGANSVIAADLDVPFGESSCISCGTCLQVCPTGALIDRRSSFMPRDIETEHVKSVCTQCSLGCGMEVVVHHDDVLRIEGDWDAKVNEGLLCQKGRFDPLYDERERVTKPLVRREGELQEVDWNEAVEAIVAQLGDDKNVGALASTMATNEALYLFGKLFRDELGTRNVGALNGAVAPQLSESLGTIAAIPKSDLILVVGANPVDDQPVASFFIKRAVDNGVRLVVVDDSENDLNRLAYKSLAMEDVGLAVDLAKRATNPVVVCGAKVNADVANVLKKLEDKATFVVLEPGVNTRAAEAYGLNNSFDAAEADTLFVLAGEQTLELKGVDAETFVVAQACYQSALTKNAAVVLPMATWAERDGSVVNTEGKVQKVNKAVTPKGDAKADWEILAMLADKLGKKLGASLDEISASATQQL